ncbi:DUF2784 domain-containing protein [Methylomarinum vadi]|uniref:DUF2784 domain-containing protein n=1 Tax=Methylomarinum vadi TaxID=438855 RepID=UPI0009FCB4AC|nr:DUF2784 domain-containing protein [Methylomarinum vadi]
MANRVIADILAIIHFGFIVFVVLGGLLLFKYRWVALLHLPAVLWGALLELKGWYCPLTDWENHFRQAADQSGYSGGFIEHYLIPLIYPPALTENIQIFLGVAVIVINVFIYAHVIRSLSRKNGHSFSKKKIDQQRQQQADHDH